MQKSLLIFVASLALASLPGCYRKPRMDYGSIGLVAAHGVVTLDQQRLAEVTVLFEAPDKQFSYATNDAEGKYSLQFDSNHAGVTQGPKVVRISALPGAAGEEAGSESSAEEGDAKPPAAVERVPARYNRQSELTVDVGPDRTEYNFDLTSN